MKFAKTVDQLLLDYKFETEERKKTFKTECWSILTNQEDPDFAKVQPGTDYYGPPSYYPSTDPSKPKQPMTYCNIFVYLALVRLGYGLEVSKLFGLFQGKPNMFYTPINLFLANCQKTEKKDGSVREVSFIEAQRFACWGAPVIIIQPENNLSGNKKDYGHMAMVWPQDEIYPKPNSMLVVGAGSRPVFGVKTFQKVFLDNNYDPKFYHVVRQS